MNRSLAIQVVPLALLLGCLTGCVRVPKQGGTGQPTETPLIVVTFNTGTSEGVVSTAEGEDGYGQAQAAVSDEWYGDGLAWTPAVEATRSWFARFSPDLVVFQEAFPTADCATIPEENHAGFICETWSGDTESVVQEVLGVDYQVACHPGKPDKCAAVHARIGTFDGCTDAFCADGLRGATIDGCGSGARVATGTIVGADGTEVLQLTNIHGSSGLEEADRACRLEQIAQVFDAMGDAAPAVSPNLPDVVMGDLNTDPYRFAEIDESAAEWAARVPLDPSEPRSHGLQFISQVGPDAPGSYGGVADIDHVFADAHEGACERTLLDGSEPSTVYAPAYFDHRPVVCELRPR